MSSASGVIIGVVGIIAAFFASLLVTDVEGNFAAVDKLSSITFWIVWAVVFFIVISVWVTNYRATKKEAKNDDNFKSSISHYSTTKTAIIDKTEYLPEFAQFKNEEMRLFLERIVVESAELVYSKYKNNEYDLKLLQKWQLKKLKNLRKIKIKRLSGYDLLQEHQFSKKLTYSFLPQDEGTAERHGMMKTGFVKAINTFAFMFVGGLVFATSGWVAGIINSFGVLSAWIGAMVSANQYVESILRQRVIGKADLLTEFAEWMKKRPNPPVVVQEALQPVVTPQIQQQLA
jgi:ABC-type multidrug transport system fused ATPase/permease subunit